MQEEKEYIYLASGFYIYKLDMEGNLIWKTGGEDLINWKKWVNPRTGDFGYSKRENVSPEERKKADGKFGPPPPLINPEYYYVPFSICAIDVDDRYVYATDLMNERIQIFDKSTGKFIKKINIEGLGLTVDSNRNIYVAVDEGKLVKLSFDGNVIWKKEELPSPFDYEIFWCVIDEKRGFLYISELEGTIGKLNLKGEFLKTIFKGADFCTFALDKDGSIYFLDLMERVIKKLSPEGEIVATFDKIKNYLPEEDHPGFLLAVPASRISISKKGEIYVWIPYFREIIVLNKNGEVIKQLALKFIPISKRDLPCGAMKIHP
jgi:hypothetical protein